MSQVQEHADSTVAVAGVLSPATHVDMPDDAKIKIGTGDDLNLYHDGSNSYIDNATGALNVATGTSGIAINIGHGTSEVTVGDNLTVAGNLTVQGTQTVVDTVTMNAANAIVFEGATADDHETTLTIVDPTADRTINLPNQSGTIPVLAAASNTAITSTPAELNLLDGVTATTAEINLLDGGTSASSVTVVDADRVLLNDNGTMKQVAVTDLAAYFDDEITAMPNLVSTGALNSGSITSGFGTIDNGSSAITTTGTVNFGSLSDGTITVTGFVDEDNMASDSATLVPTQQSVLAYITATMGSVTSASNSAAAAAASLDSFDDRYLGAKSSAPSVDNDGNSLITGALYFNSTSDSMQVRTSGGGWTNSGSSVNGTSSRESFVVGTSSTNTGGVSYTGSTTSFPISYDAGYVDVYLNGVKLKNATDVTVTSGSAVVLASAAATGDILDAIGYGTFTVSDHYTKTESDNKYAIKAGATFTGTTSFSDGNITNVGNIALDSLTADGSTITITGNTTFADGAYDFDIASHDTSNGLKLGGTLVTATAAELNILDGVTSTAAELNILDGVTSTAAELNILDGVTSTATELNLVDGSVAGTIVNSKAVVYSSGGQVNATTLAIAGTAITSTAAELNILDGVTSTAAELNILDGVTATATELNLIDGVTATTAELNILDGVTSTASELNILDGVTATAAELNYLDIATLGVSAASKAVTADANNVVTFSGGIAEDSVTISSSSNAATINLREGTSFLHDLTENVTYTFSNPPASGNSSIFTLKIIQGSSARVITWPSSVDWVAATAPTLTATDNGVDIFVFQTIDGGTTYYGFVAGQAFG